MKSSVTHEERRELDEAEILDAIRVKAGAPEGAEVKLIKHHEWSTPEAIITWKHREEE